MCKLSLNKKCTVGMARERDGAVQAIRSILVRAILRQNRFDLLYRNFIKSLVSFDLQKEEIIRFVETFN